MTKSEMKELICNNKNDLLLFKLFFRYDKANRYLITLSTGDRLFLAVEEDDFDVDGYTIRRYRDITKFNRGTATNKKILELEKILDRINPPSVNLSNWQTVFESLYDLDINVIIEIESNVDADSEFYIGKIEKILKRFVRFRYFDADGHWDEAPTELPYTEITSVTFLSRYVTIFSKYIDPLPANFGK